MPISGGMRQLQNPVCITGGPLPVFRNPQNSFLCPVLATAIPHPGAWTPPCLSQVWWALLDATSHLFSEAMLVSTSPSEPRVPTFWQASTSGSWLLVSWVNIPMDFITSGVQEPHTYSIFSVFSKAYGTVPDYQYVTNRYLWTWR